MPVPLILSQEIDAAYDMAQHARETLERVLDEMNHVGVEWEEAYEKAREAEEDVIQSMHVGVIPMRTVTAITQQGGEIPVQIKDHMIYIAGRMNHMRDAVEDAVAAQSKEEVEELLNETLQIAQGIEGRWMMIRQLSVEPINMYSNNESNASNASNNELSGGRRLRMHRGKTHRGKTHRKRNRKQKTHRKRN